MALADAWDAMTSDRPYRPGMSAARAYEICQEELRSQFCPDVVAALVRLWEGAGMSDAEEQAAPHRRPAPQVPRRPGASLPRRRERAPVSGSGLVYRGQAISEGEPGSA